jgi:hypothetical protein
MQAGRPHVELTPPRRAVGIAKIPLTTVRCPICTASGALKCTGTGVQMGMICVRHRLTVVRRSGRRGLRPVDAAVTLAPVRRATDNRLADSIIAGQQMPQLRLPASQKLKDLKPHIEMFLSPRRADATPQQVRHVGDAPGADMLGDQ